LSWEDSGGHDDKCIVLFMYKSNVPFMFKCFVPCVSA